MNNLIDKFIIFIVCLTIYIPNINNNYKVIPILIAVFLSAILSYMENRTVLIGVFTCFIILCFFNPSLTFFSPLICYDLFFYNTKWLWALLLLPFYTNLYIMPDFTSLLILSYILIAYILAYRTTSFENIKKNYYNLSDANKELSIVFEKKNRDLLENQDYEVNLATLRERNRIARDIHDNVGHLLSRCILQIGALLAINKNESIDENLTLIKYTLSEAMDSIRNSVHDLHEESINLQIEIQNLVNEFKFCDVKLDYDIESSPKKNIKYAFITITKEALSNIIKHSNADEVLVVFREHPALYQLIIKDNGRNIKYHSKNGIGLENIKDRVSSLGGNMNIETDNGFRIFIAIPKA